MYSSAKPINQIGKLKKAHSAENQALQEYMRVLRVFHELMLENKLPEGE